MKDFFKIMNQPVDGKTKFKFVMRYINEEPALKLGRELHSHGPNLAQQIYFWRQLYLKAGISALKPKSHDQKTKHKRKHPVDWSKFTREELIEVIKIYDKFINKNKANKRRDKFQVFKNYRGVLSIKKLCLVLDLNRSSYYGGLKNPPHSPYNATGLAQLRQLYYEQYHFWCSPVACPFTAGF